MAKVLNLATLVALAIAATLFGHTTATSYTYTVGDSLGWSYPPSSTTYATWAAKYTFVVGDVLLFNFVTGQHSVATVTKESFDTCNKSNLISLITSGPASITLYSTGETYFLCIYGGHCSFGGQKLAISVIASTSNTPSSPPPPLRYTPPLATSPPPPPLRYSPPPTTNPPPSLKPTPSTLPRTPPPGTSPPALGLGLPAPTGSVIPPPPSTSPRALNHGGPAPAGFFIAIIVCIFVLFIVCMGIHYNKRLQLERRTTISAVPASLVIATNDPRPSAREKVLSALTAPNECNDKLKHEKTSQDTSHDIRHEKSNELPTQERRRKYETLNSLFASSSSQTTEHQ